MRYDCFLSLFCPFVFYVRLACFELVPLCPFRSCSLPEASDSLLWFPFFWFSRPSVFTSTSSTIPLPLFSPVHFHLVFHPCYHPCFHPFSSSSLPIIDTPTLNSLFSFPPSWIQRLHQKERESLPCTVQINCLRNLIPLGLRGTLYEA